MTDGAHIRPLTGLRFFAAFWVVLFHYWHILDTPWISPIVERGYLGVEAFFTLSGFILCHVYLSAYEGGTFRYGGFIWNRLARVYPLHLVTLIGMGAMAGAGLALGFRVDPNILSWAALPANLTLTHAWGLAPVAGWNHPSWSISAEWFAYLTFPLFAWAAVRLRTRPWLAVAAAFALLVGLYWAFDSIAGFPLARATFRWGALRIIPTFALGCSLYLLWRSLAADGRNWGYGAAFFGACALAGAQFGAGDALIVGALGGLILSLAQWAKGGETVAGHPVFVYLGEISYSVYMVCIPWQILFSNSASHILGISHDRLPLYIWLVLLFGVIPLSAASYHLVEQPARRWMKLIAVKRRDHALATV